VTSLLAVDHVTQRFGKLVAVNGLSMLVAPGELRAVIGPNGAGKTTFFNLVSGLITPTSGRIYFDGRDVTSLTPEERVGLGVARTFQITEIFPELTVGENLRIAVEVTSGQRLRMWRSRTQDAEVRGRVDELLGLAGLHPRADRLVGELSHGDQRATEILMALALAPRLLLLDEPTAGMSDQETYGIAELVQRLHREQRLTILLVEHDMRVVAHLADRITVLAEGATLAEGTFDEVCCDERVQTAYLGSAR